MDENQMQHGIHWRGEDLAGWIATEKFDGIRAYYDGHGLWTRGGKAIPIPDHWRDELPGTPLDCELFAGYDNRKAAESFARGRFSEGVYLQAFDAPCHQGDYLTRLQSINSGIFVRRVKHSVITDNADALELMHRVQTFGGEGIMVRHPDLAYRPGRTNKMLKVKYEA